MKKVVELLVKTPKNLYGKKKKTCSMGNGRNKSLPSPEPPLQQPPHKKELLMVPSILEWDRQ
jgi:hypothetical protein